MEYTIREIKKEEYELLKRFFIGSCFSSRRGEAAF